MRIPNETGTLVSVEKAAASFHDNSGTASYLYKDECISFFWVDSGIDPRIMKKGNPGITVHCDKWSTPDGLHVGSSMKEVGARIGQYCPTNRNNRFIIYTKVGIAYEAKDRNSPVSLILVIPVMDSWDGRSVNTRSSFRKQLRTPRCQRCPASSATIAISAASAAAITFSRSKIKHLFASSARQPAPARTIVSIV